MKLIIILLLLLLLLLLFIINNKRDIELFENIWMWYCKDKGTPNGGLGNILSVFFSKKSQNIVLNKKNTNIIHNSIENSKFIKLDNNYTLSNDQVIKLKNVYLEGGDYFWNIFSVDSLAALKIIKPNVKNSLNYFVEDIKTPVIEKIPIIHYRCSDVPFVKHGCYHFSKYKFYDWCHTKLNKKYKKWYIMFNSNHLSKPEYNELSTIYFNDLLKYLKTELKLNIELLKPNDTYTDFKLLYNAPVVIQGGCGGSFSFFSGFFNGLYLFSDINKPESNLTKEYNLDIEYYKNGILSHNEVDNVGGYSNTQNVINLLRA